MLKNTAIVALDIERTGQGPNDVTFAIGVADTVLSKNTTSKINKAAWIIQLRGHGNEEEWRQFWLDNNYDMDCFNEFWSKNIDVLNNLMINAHYSDEGELSGKLNNYLENIENINHNRRMLVFDTITFDSVHLDNLLKKSGYKGLSFTRSGKYTSSMELDSYTYGVLGLDMLNDTWQQFKKLKSRLLDKRLPSLGITSNNHFPDDDAENILVSFLRAVDYAASCKNYKRNVTVGYIVLCVCFVLLLLWSCLL